MSALLLLSSLPAWQHSHPDGNLPHTHRTADDHDYDGMSLPQAHQHITLFGFDLTLPVDPDDCEFDDCQPTYLVPAPSAIEISPSVSHFVTWALPSFDAGQPVQIVPTFRCITAIADHLSDSARHERSGVLLI